jgi:hypothetical protein
VSGLLALSACCSPGSKIPSKYVVPDVEFVTSTQQAPDVAERSSVKSLLVTSYVAWRVVLPWGEETAGGCVMGVVVAGWLGRGLGADELDLPLAGPVLW